MWNPTPTLQSCKVTPSRGRTESGLTLTEKRGRKTSFFWVDIGWVPEGLPNELWLAPTIDRASLPHWPSTTEPQATRYLFVPSPLAPDSVVIFNNSSFHAQPIGVLQFGYYELLAGLGEWTQVRASDGQVGWVGPNASLQVGTRQDRQELVLDEVLRDSNAVASAYTADQLPQKYQPARNMLADELSNQGSNFINYGYIVYEVVTEGRIDPIGLVCVSSDLISDYTEANLKAINLSCIAWDLAAGTAVVILGGSPLGLYVVVSSLVLEYWRPFVRWNNRVWLMELYQQSSSCLLTELIAGPEVQAACLGLPQ